MKNHAVLCNWKRLTKWGILLGEEKAGALVLIGFRPGCLDARPVVCLAEGLALDTAAKVLRDIADDLEKGGGSCVLSGSPR